MKIIKIAVLSILTLMITSCSQEKLPKSLLSNDVGYNKLFNYIYSHYPNLEEEGVEILDFTYSESVHPQRDEISSDISVNFVRGNNKNRIVEYRLNNEGLLGNNNVNISVGDFANKKLSNSYETYKPYLFSNKKIDLNLLRTIVEKATVEIKEQANINKVYCSGLYIEKKNGVEPIITIVMKQREFITDIRRATSWTIGGEKIK